MRIVWEERDDRCSGRYGWFGRPTAWQSCTLGLWERSGRPPVTPPGDLEHVPMVWRPLRIQEAPSARPFSIDSMDDYIQYGMDRRPLLDGQLGQLGQPWTRRAVIMLPAVSRCANCEPALTRPRARHGPWAARQAQSERERGCSHWPTAACCVLRAPIWRRLQWSEPWQAWISTTSGSRLLDQSRRSRLMHD